MGSHVLGLDGPREALMCWRWTWHPWSGLHCSTALHQGRDVRASVRGTWIPQSTRLSRILGTQVNCNKNSAALQHSQLGKAFFFHN